MASFTVLFSLVLCTVLCANAASIKPRIVGGNTAAKNQFKYSVGIAIESTSVLSFISGGVTLTDRHILSSANCLDEYKESPENLIVILGSPSYDADDETIQVEIQSVILHPDFHQLPLIYDLAVLRTTKKIPFSDAIQPVALPESDLTNENGLEAVVTGWGILNASESLSNMVSAGKLQYLKTKVLRHDDCIAEYALDLGESHEMEEILIMIDGPNKFCTSNPKDEGVCAGDIGSPLVADGTLIGIVTWATECALGLPDVYTNVYANLNWIHSEMSK